jgi:LysR family hydrogen peroxide-inducible transcriptional activator
VLTLGAGHQLHDVVQRLCEEMQARLRHDYEGTSLDTLREMVAMGMGTTFLPQLYVEAELDRDDSVKTMTLRDRSITRILGIAWRRSSARQATYQRLARFFSDALRPAGTA